MEESSGSAANNVARAISAAFDWNSPTETRNAAVAYLDSFKSGDIRVLASTSFQLVRKEWSSEIRLHGFKMLQHLVRFRWDEFGISERTEFANATVNLILEMANPSEEWVLKSQTAALVAEVVRREGINLWHELLPSLVSLSNKGPVEAELVAMMLRWLPEDITVHNEDLEGDRRRVLLRGLTESLTEILPLLYSLLEKHFGAALSESGMQHFDIAKQHAATVTSALNAINAYAEWAPVPDLAKCGLIQGCGFLLSSLDFRLHACEFFKLVSQRKRPADATAPDFDSAMKNIFQILMNISREFLSRFGSSIAGIDESDLEFVECLCESMVALGSSHLQSITVDGSMISLFLQQMLGYFQHFKFSLHFQSLLFWLALMRESAPKAKAAAQIAGNNPSISNQGFGSVQLENEKKGISAFIDDGICAAILDVSFQRMLKKNVTPGSVTSNEALELWNDEFDGKCDFSQYRSRLLELIRLVTSQKPIVTVARVSQRIQIIVESCAHLSMSSQDIALMESMQLGLETIVTTIFDGSAVFVISSSEIKFQLHRIFEGLLQQLLSMKWAEAALAVVHARYLDSFGSYLKHFPDAVVGVVTKLFELLRSLPLQTDPSNTARFARLQVCTSFIRIARSAEESLIPQMKDIADSMARLEGEGLLLRSEHNILGEAVLIMASFAGSQQQQEVLAWLLGPLSKQWMQLEWQNAYLSNPLGLAQLCTDTQFMWSIFHTVTFFEKALKRSGVKKANLHLQSCSTNSNLTHPHPLSSHLTWMLPPLLRLLRSIHSLWSPPIDQALTGELRAAKGMSHVEHVSLLGEGNFKLPKDQSGYVDGIETTETKESNMRNWLKCIRDSGYTVVGLATTIGDAFFRCIDNHSVTLALMENIQSMEFRHLRQLIHSVLIPLVKSCPVELWSMWLENLLQPLFLHCHQVLTCSWSGLLREGRAKIPDTFGNLSGMDLKVEVMEEKLLRDLTREVCLLLSVLASSGLNSGLPSLEQLGNANRMEASLGDLDVFASNSMIGFFVKHKGLALPALRICIEAFAWTDGEAVSKLTHFCGTLIHLAVSSNDVELREFITKDLFYAIIQGLALESNAIISADLVGLCREIFVYLSDRDPAPRQVLLSLPCITRDDLVAFEDNLTKTTSAKEQKQLMRSLLVSATGNKLKALVAQKPTNTITNVTARSRTPARTPAQNNQEDNLIGLAAIT